MRRAVWIAGTLIIGVLLSQCGGSDGDSGATTVNLVVWKPNNPAAWDSALVLFHNAHPDIKIVREIGPHSSSQFHDLVAQKLRNQDPSVDAFLMDVVWTPEFAAAGWAIPLNRQFPPSEQGKFFDGCIEADVWNDSIYGVPLNIDAGILYYRKDLLDKYGFAPPRTWPEMLAQIDTILAGENEPRLNGYSGQFRQYEGLVCDMLEFVRSNGGRLTEPQSPATMEAVRFVRDRLIGRAAPRGVLTYSEQESLDLFSSGGAIFHRNWPYAWALTKESPIAGNVGIAPLPTFKDNLSTSTLGGWRFGISRFSRNKDAAWTVVQFFTSPEIQKHFAVLAGRAPARKALYQDPDVLEANPHYEEMFPVFENATPRPRTPVYPQVSNILQRFLHAALSEQDADLDALAAKASKEIEAALGQVQ
ncbi:MAG: ABC transporter substrate-binding protein [Candidatus Zixiibacteriota bacterium]